MGMKTPEKTSKTEDWGSSGVLSCMKMPWEVAVKNSTRDSNIIPMEKNEIKSLVVVVYKNVFTLPFFASERMHLGL